MSSQDWILQGVLYSSSVRSVALPEVASRYQLCTSDDSLSLRLRLAVCSAWYDALILGLAL